MNGCTKTAVLTVGNDEQTRGVRALWATVGACVAALRSGRPLAAATGGALEGVKAGINMDLMDGTSQMFPGCLSGMEGGSGIFGIYGELWNSHHSFNMQYWKIPGLPGTFGMSCWDIGEILDTLEHHLPSYHSILGHLEHLDGSR
jgi:hypothetical protein